MERHEMIRRDMRWRGAAAEEGGLYGEEERHEMERGCRGGRTIWRDMR